jgi:hypothetical protein
VSLSADLSVVPGNRMDIQADQDHTLDVDRSAHEAVEFGPYARNHPKSYVTGFVVLGVVLAFDLWIFAVLTDTTYPGWIRHNSAVLAIGTVVFGVVIRQGFAGTWRRDAISAHPLAFPEMFFELSSGLLTALANGARQPTYAMIREPDLGDSWWVRTKSRVVGRAWDALITGMAIIVSSIAWFIVVYPIRYALVLVLGAPARLAATSEPAQERGVRLYHHGSYRTVVPTLRGKGPEFTDAMISATFVAIALLS